MYVKGENEGELGGSFSSVRQPPFACEIGRLVCNGCIAIRASEFPGCEGKWQGSQGGAVEVAK
jgi:hypothetical protein